MEWATIAFAEELEALRTDQLDALMSAEAYQTDIVASKGHVTCYSGASATTATKRHHRSIKIEQRAIGDVLLTGCLRRCSLKQRHIFSHTDALII